MTVDFVKYLCKLVGFNHCINYILPPFRYRMIEIIRHLNLIKLNVLLTKSIWITRKDETKSKNSIIDVKQKSYQSSTLQTSTTIVRKPVLETQKPKEKKRILRGQDATPNNDHKKTFTFRPADTCNKRRQRPKTTVHKPERGKVKIKRWKKVEKQPQQGSWKEVETGRKCTVEGFPGGLRRSEVG